MRKLLKRIIELTHRTIESAERSDLERRRKNLIDELNDLRATRGYCEVREPILMIELSEIHNAQVKPSLPLTLSARGY